MRDWRREHAVLTLLTLFWLALPGCAIPTNNRPAATPTVPLPTATPSPQAVRVIPKTTRPAGWQTYQGPHFTLAYPPDWRAQGTTRAGTPAAGQQQVTVYAFGSRAG